MRKQFYLDLVEKLQEINTTDYPSTVEHFDLWNRQIEFLSKERPFKFPAVFVEFSPIQWDQQGNGVQEGDLTFRLHVVSKTLSGSSPSAPGQEDFLAHFDLIDDIHHCLSRWNTAYSGPCTRVQSIPNHDHEQIIEEVEVYKLRVVDTSGARRFIEVSAKESIEAHLHGRE